MNKRKALLIFIDTLIIVAVYICCFILSTFQPGSIVLHNKFSLINFLGIYACIIIVRAFLKIYTNMWRYARPRLYFQLMISDAISCIIFIILGRIVSVFNIGIGYSLLIFMMVLILTLTSRFVYQIIYARNGKNADVESATSKLDGEPKEKTNVVIVGAGNIGALLAEELVRNPKSKYEPYCFFDTDVQKIGKQINGLKIYPEDENTVKLIRSMPVQEIIIALPDLDAERKYQLYNLYKQTDCKVKLYDYPLDRSSSVSAKRTLREFNIEELLFRKPIKIENPAARKFYANKVILVTGGGGSIGSELCRQIARCHPKKLVILDIYENNAYEIQQELIRRYKGKLKLDVVIASVRDVKRLDDIFREVRPQIVFHAAAHKHVPLMERSGVEALKNNAFGTYNVANLSEKYNVEKFLLISTDKAVNPTNIMGASKRLCEMVIQCRGNSKTDFTAVRFGNVLGSNGSVIPLFKEQIASGGPVTLTDKRIVRYFMTIPEAVQLVMETCVMAKSGELFVLDMGKPVKILDLAENMIRLSGLKPYEDIDIVEIGLRPGEKLYEELLIKTENLDKTDNNLIFIERDEQLSRSQIDEKLEILSQAIKAGDNQSVMEAVMKTVPTFHRPEEINDRV